MTEQRQKRIRQVHSAEKKSSQLNPTAHQATVIVPCAGAVGLIVQMDKNCYLTGRSLVQNLEAEKCIVEIWLTE